MCTDSVFSTAVSTVPDLSGGLALWWLAAAAAGAAPPAAVAAPIPMAATGLPAVAMLLPAAPMAASAEGPAIAAAAGVKLLVLMPNSEAAAAVSCDANTHNKHTHKKLCSLMAAQKPSHRALTSYKIHEQHCIALSRWTYCQ